LYSVDEPNQRLSLDLLIVGPILSTLTKYMNFSQWLRKISKRLEFELSELEGTQSLVLLNSPKAELQYQGVEPLSLDDFLKSSTVRTPSS